jgi:hypothetical protein
MIEKQKGQPNHLFLGHGLDQRTFEKREFATTSDLAFGQKQTTGQIIHPKVFQGDSGASRTQIKTNASDKDAPALFKYGQHKIGPKSYNQFTAKFDNNSLNLKLRQ